MAEQVNLQPPTVHHDAIRVALDCLEEGFQIIGRDWRYVYVNPAAARRTAMSASDKALPRAGAEDADSISPSDVAASVRTRASLSLPSALSSDPLACSSSISPSTSAAIALMEAFGSRITPMIGLTARLSSI